MNPDYYDDIEKFIEKYSKNYFKGEKLEWHEEMEKKQLLYDDYFHDEPSYFSNCYIRKNIHDLPAEHAPTEMPADLKVGQLVRFREGTADVLEGSMGIIVDRNPGEVQVMTSGDQLVWSPDRVMEVISASR
jgi:hypothetical protein